MTGPWDGDWSEVPVRNLTRVTVLPCLVVASSLEKFERSSVLFSIAFRTKTGL